MSVLHIVLKKHANYEHPIKSKERMIFHIGPRKFSACPIYSQHTNANKQKVSKFQQLKVINLLLYCRAQAKRTNAQLSVSSVMVQESDVF